MLNLFEVTFQYLLGYPELRSAAINGRTENIIALINAGVNVNTISGDYECTPLMYAAENGHTGTVRALKEGNTLGSFKNTREIISFN